MVAVMSRNGAKAKAYAQERNIPKWYDDAQELIDDEDVNAVYIATPPSSHATYAIMSMKAGKPVYIENRWPSPTKNAAASTASPKRQACPASWPTTAAICLTSRK